MPSKDGSGASRLASQYHNFVKCATAAYPGESQIFSCNRAKERRNGNVFQEKEEKKCRHLICKKRFVIIAEIYDCILYKTLKMKRHICPIYLFLPFAGIENVKITKKKSKMAGSYGNF